MSTRAARKAAQEAKILLAPLPLYRQVLRVHRCLPPAMRSMGDDYVKSEFRRHKDIDNPVHIIGFISQWQEYLETMKLQTAPPPTNTTEVESSTSHMNDHFVRSFNTPNDGWGKKMNDGVIDKMSDEQIGQLYELRTEVRKSLGHEK